MRAYQKHIAPFYAIDLILVGGKNKELDQYITDEYCSRVAGKFLVKPKGHVIFTGERRDICQMINAMDICCLPSLTEGFSNALLEYLVIGKSVVATCVGGNPEVIKDGVNGFLVPPNNANLLAAKISAILRDVNLQKKMGKMGRSFVREKFSAKKVAKQYQKVYSSLEKA